MPPGPVLALVPSVAATFDQPSGQAPMSQSELIVKHANPAEYQPTTEDCELDDDNQGQGDSTSSNNPAEETEEDWEDGLPASTI
jgi:hypothetical protein